MTALRLLPSIPGVAPASRGEQAPLPEARFDLAELAGRLSELAGNATLTLAMRLVADAQQHDEPVAWLTARQATFYPPDAAAAGVALDRLVVVRVPENAQVPRAADQLARSNGFGLLVLDLGELSPGSLPAPLWSRLGGLAQKHGTAIVCLTRTPAHAPSLGALVSWRGQAERVSRADGKFGCTLRVIKDRRRQPGWKHEEVRLGPVGLR